MKSAIFFLALFHSVLMLDQEPVPVKYNLYNQTLCMGDSMQLGDKTIRLNKVISDSRCPRGEAVTCIWAGEVKILMEFYENGEFKGDKVITGSNTSINNNEVVVATNISIAEFFQTNNLDISSVAVYPYPKVNQRITSEEYSIKLQVSEKINSD